MNGLPTTEGLFEHIPFESPGKWNICFLAKIFRLFLPKIWHVHPNINYFSEMYMKRQIIPKSFKALAVILKLSQSLELLVIFIHFLAKFGWKHPYVNQLPWKPHKINTAFTPKS